MNNLQGEGKGDSVIECRGGEEEKKKKVAPPPVTFLELRCLFFNDLFE